MTAISIGGITDAHKVYEKAARLLCVKRGLDPDERITKHVGSGRVVTGAMVGVPQWVLAAEELIAFSQCLVALREAAQKTDEAVVTSNEERPS